MVGGMWPCHVEYTVFIFLAWCVGNATFMCIDDHFHSNVCTPYGTTVRDEGAPNLYTPVSTNGFISYIQCTQYYCISDHVVSLAQSINVCVLVKIS